jgi:hypothetical protein
MTDGTTTALAQRAIYHEQVIPGYRGNPFIESLPPFLDRAAAQDLMRHLPHYDDGMRSQPAMMREHLASTIGAIRQPTWLHGELYSRLSRLICNGYVGRNPISPDFQATIAARTASLDGAGEALGAASYAGPRTNGGYHLASNLAPDSNGLTFLGTSGIGKSTALKMVLGLWPQLVVHSEYAGRTFSRVQVNWLKLDAPDDGNVNTLADRFFELLDDLHLQAGIPSDFKKAFIKGRSRAGNVAFDMARVAQQVGLGLLVLDEIQDLSESKSRGFLNFIVQLVNRIGLPVVLVGGLDAFHLVSAQFRQVRRSSTEGDLVVTQSQQGKRWKDFCKVLWRYQYTTDWTEMTDAHAEALFDVSQGITDFLVIAFKNAQIRAISTGAPVVTPAHIRSIRNTLNLAGPALGALRRNSAFVIDRLSDLKVPAGVLTQPFLRADDVQVAPSGEPTTPVAKSVDRGETNKGGDGDPGAHRQDRETAHRAQVVGEQPASSDRGAPDSEMSETDSLAADDQPRPASVVTSAKGSPAPDPKHPTMHEIVMAGAERGLTPRDALAAAGVGAGELWRKMAGLQP